MTVEKKEGVARTPKKSRQFKTEAGIEIDQLYTPESLDGFDYQRDLGNPGEYPFTRGLYPAGYRDRLWMFRQISGHGTVKETLERARYLRDHGGVSAEGIVPLSIYMDAAHHLGLDSDDPMAEYDLGRGGVGLDTLEDLQEFLSDFDLTRIHINFQCFQEAALLLAMYLAAAKERKVAVADLRGGLENEVFGSFIYCKQEIFPVRSAVKMAWDAAEYVARYMPRFTSNVFSDASYMPAGANPVQSAGIAMSAALAFIEAGLSRGLSVDKTAEPLSFYMGTSRDFFEQIARLRAFRRLWAKFLKERYHAQTPKAWMARIVVRTSTRDLTAQQPMVNLVRVGIQALSAALSGVQAITCTPFDEPLCLPTEASSLLALRTQHVIAEETGVINTVDPLGGAYFVENLTNEMERKIREYVAKIESQGGDGKGDTPMLDGMVKGIESGFFDRELLASAWALKQATESGERTVVGVNKYVVPAEGECEITVIDQENLDRKIQALKKFKAGRDKARVQRYLDEVTMAARKGENTLPVMADAFIEKATMGEVTKALQAALGAYKKLT